jgi:AcrR family transcriptional regulator
MKDSRDYILKTAFSLFISKGYKSVTMNDMENATRLTKGAFYHHFKNKEDLFQAVIEKYYLSSHLNCNSDNFSTLKEYISFITNYLSEKMLDLKEFTGGKIPDPYYMTIILEAKKYLPSLDEKIKNTFRSQINQWEKIIVKAKNAEEIKSNIDSSILAETFTSIGLGVLKNLILDDTVDYSVLKIKMQYEQLYKLLL